MPLVIVKLFILNGATVNAANNIDLGIYSEDGTRLVSSGSTAQGSANTLQEFDITDTLIGPGKFYLAQACDTTAATFWQFPLNAVWHAKAVGIKEQATAFALPASATFATFARSWIPAIGATTRVVV